MNPKNLNDERELDAWLTRNLQNQSDYIDDAGFTEGVMNRLPENPSRRFAPLLWLLLAVVTVGLSALLLVPAQTWAYALAANLLAVSLTSLIQGGLLVTAALITGAVYWIWQEN